ncbi:MAG: F0F1 ATP synthase subunit delta [Patescibacteria group bacterium]
MKPTAKQYANVLHDITEGKTGKVLELVVKDFVALLSDRHERSRHREIARVFESVWRRRYGTATVRLETAQAISAELDRELKERFTNATIEKRVNKELLGGARLQIDDRLLDGSIAGQLSRLKSYLINS